MEINNTNKIAIETPIKNLLNAIFNVKTELGSTILAEGKNPHYGNDFIQFHRLVKKIDPICKRYGVGISQFPTGVGLVTLIFHQKTGEYITSYYELKLDKQTSQGVGSALSYAKRQTYQAIFGLSAAAEEDDDAELATEEEQFESWQEKNGKLTANNAYQIAKVALQEINSIVGLEEWKKIQPPIVRDNMKIRELVKAKEAEIKMAA